MPPRILVVVLLAACSYPISATVADERLDRYREAGLADGDADRGRLLFESEKLACHKCHSSDGKQKLAGPALHTIGDKYTEQQLTQAILEPSAAIHPDYATLIVTLNDGRSFSGVLQDRTAEELTLFDNTGSTRKISISEIDAQDPSRTSLMPANLPELIEPDQFTDLIAYLRSLRQTDTQRHPGLPREIQPISSPIRLEPFHPEGMRFDHPVWMIAKPGEPDTYLVVEQQQRKVWQLRETETGMLKTLFADLSDEAITGQFEGVMCLAFHPDFLRNGKYYVNYHVREDGVFSPVIAERVAAPNRSRDAGGRSRRILKIDQPTELHWGGMLAFGPDGYLYIGAGDGGPQEDPRGHGQDLSSLMGKILRIDVNESSSDKAYGIPATNPFPKTDGVRPEIWAYGFRMPWRFSWDTKTHDLWVGDIGQYLFEEVSIARVGENHGWNVYEGFTPFSDRYRRDNESFTPPIISYRRKEGVSVTGGYVYRGNRSPSFAGAYLFSDFESKRIWALTQEGRQLTKVRQIGNSPEKPASFAIAPDGELFLIGYEGTIYRVILDDAVFE